MFVTLMVNAFDFRDKDDNSDSVDGSKSAIKRKIIVVLFVLASLRL